MSNYEINVETLAPQPVLSQRFKVALAEIGAKFAEVLPAVYGHALAGPAKPNGQPFARYHSMPVGGTIDVEAGVPTDGRGEPKGDIKVCELPGGPAAATVHTGPYDQLANAHAALQTWAQQQGRQPAGPPWEVYLTDPGAEPDPAKWQTKVFLPLT